MSSTPSPPAGKAATTQPAKTPGFAAGLFGLFSSKKMSLAVDSSTVPTPSVTRSPRNHHHRPMDISLTSPFEQETAMDATSNNNTNRASAIDLLDTDGPTASPKAVQPAPALAAMSLPSKSPWKSPSARTMNGVSAASNIRFSVGNLKPPPPPTGGTSGRRSLSRKSGLGGRMRYKPSTLLMSGKRRRTGPVNPVNAVNALQHSQNLFQPSSRQVEARSNYTSFRAGKRLLGSSQRGGSRLVPTDLSKDASRNAQEDEPTSPVEPATKRRKQVMFGGDDFMEMDSKPVESEMMTPVRPSGVNFMKKKATPFKLSTYAGPEDAQDTPTKSPASSSLSPPSQASLVPRPVVKLELETGDYVFEKSEEAEPLGPPVATRTPPFLNRTTLKVNDAPFPTTPRTFYEPMKPGNKKQAATPLKTNTSTPMKNGSSAAPNGSTGWGSLFADQKNKWKCAACSVLNEQSLSKCASCETVRPGHEDKAAGSSGGGGGATQGAIGAGGFTFGGAAPAATGGFSFGSAPAPPSSASAPATGGFSFQGGSSTTTSSSTIAPSGGGFTFGAASAASVAAAPAPAKDSKSNSAPAPTFSFGAPAPAASTESKSLENKEATNPPGFSFASAPDPALASTDGETKPFKFNVSGDEKKSDDAPKSFAFPSSSTPASKGPDPPIPATEPASRRTRPENGGNAPVPSSANKASDLKNESSSSSSSKPVFSFGGNGSSRASSGFNFGSAPAPAATKPSAPVFKFGQQPSSASETKAIVPLGSIPSKDASDDDRSKRQGGSDNVGSSSGPSFGGNASSAPTSAPAFSFGGSAAVPAPTTFGSQPSTGAQAPSFGGGAPAPAPATGGFSFGGAPAPATSSSTFKFGNTQDGDSSSSAPKFGSDSTVRAASAMSGGMAGPAFGGSAPVPPSNLNPFGSAPPAPAPAAGFSFGGGGGSSGGAAPAFGSTPAAPAPSFGAAPASAAQSFGSTPAPTAGAVTFGAAPAPAAFGSTPAGGPGSFGAPPASAPFGSTPAAPAPPAFGGAPAPAAPFGATPGGGFGGDGGGGFGVAPAAPAPAAFGAPFGAAPAPGPGGFGGGGFGAPAPPPAGGFGAPPAASGGFGGGAPGGFGGAPPAGGAAPQFSIGSGGGAGAASKTPGRRRIVKARRPRPA